MNAFLSAVLYMVIGGVVTATLINAKAKDCGPQEVKSDEVFYMVAAWPGFITAAIVTEDDAPKPSSCKPASDEGQ
ncbi:hypothetical protein [Stenotrophomonas sp. 278]|uniref:hypothetical protein n=1 Tax=Stenotrophomonas sp. 278 TaxID=2479851 RepID=UPI000F65A1CF|nr:hypothetical protein [Stenotrophomonas sp. 278]RRU17854.1 hypothetical protein EGJ34_06880 [Stenotrophomonas sp. 278]